MSVFNDLMQTIIKVYTMTDNELIKRKQELSKEISVLEELDISNSKLNFEALIIISRLIEEGKMDDDKLDNGEHGH